MKNQFDELAKAMAESVTRRAALKRFGVGCTATLLTAIGPAPRADEATHRAEEMSSVLDHILHQVD